MATGLEWTIPASGAFARERPSKTASEVRVCEVSFADKLASGEVLTGSPTVAEVTTEALTLSNKAVSTAAIIINEVSVAIGEAVTFTVAAGSAGTTYQIRINCGTDATPAQTVYGDIYLDVISN